MKKRLLLPILLLLLVSISCSMFSKPASTPQPSKGQHLPVVAGQSANQVLSGETREQLPAYTSSFTIQFNGSAPWKYQLQTRKASSMIEINLHMEGLQGANNPGDIRLVSDGTTSWMTGPGTDNECIMFPNNAGMDPTLLYPEALAPVGELSALLTSAGDEVMFGKASQHLTGKSLAVGSWKDAQVELWQEKESGALMKFIMQANGEDKFFGTGTGTLAALYTIDSLDEPTIEPVTGCEINAPLPDSASKLVRMPGMASFESTASIDQLRDFYQSRLPQENWAENEPPALSGDVWVLSYRRDALTLEIHIETIDSGSKVTLLFLQ